MLIGSALIVRVVGGLLGAAAEGVLRAAQYRYAMTGKIDPDQLPPAYRVLGTGPADTPLT
ncbi:MAG TPA: hypothetical protein VN842_02085 [Thermoplasmata archaeon]|nr:hypothetical protein [Thermoplasmata archaeon]